MGTKTCGVDGQNESRASETSTVDCRIFSRAKTAPRAGRPSLLTSVRRPPTPVQITMYRVIVFEVVRVKIERFFFVCLFFFFLSPSPPARRARNVADCVEPNSSVLALVFVTGVG